MEQTGVRLESQRYEVIAATESVRPLRDYLLLEPLPWKPSRTIQIAGDTRRTLTAKVIAAGPGCHPKRYSRDRSRMWESPAFRPTHAKVGDIVELGGLQFNGYSFFRIMIGTKPFLLARDEDICAIVETEEKPMEYPAAAWLIA